jgi:hypothetical protein
MAGKDKEYEYIAALQDFSKSVEYLIDAVKAQIQNKQDFKTSVSLAEEQFEYMKEMSEQLKVVSDTAFATKKDTEKILSVVDSIKSEKKKGIFDKLSPKDKTKSVVEGIKTITLMAGGILAIGMAFKVVGDVDFASVLALAIALPLIGTAFNQMDKSLKPKDAAILSLNMMIMSAGVAGSGYILNMMPELSFKTMISVIGVAIGMGIAMYAMSMVADNLNAKEIKSLFLLGAVMPFIAGGLVLAGMILQDMPTIPFMQTVESTAAIAVSVGIAGIAIAIMTKVGLTPVNAILGSVSMVAVAGGLMLSSWILNEGTYDNYPNLEWAKGVGLSMLASLPVVLGFGLVAATGIGALVILAGIASMIGVAAGITEVSHILKGGDYTGGPSVEWSSGVGIALMAFANSLDSLEPGLLGTLMGDSLDQRVDMILKLANVLKQTSFLIKGGDYTGGPSKEWSEGVGIAIMAFANSLDALEPGVMDTLFGDSLVQRIGLMTVVAAQLPIIAAMFNKTSADYDVTKVPSKDWGEGVGAAINGFATGMAALADEIDIEDVPLWVAAIMPLAPVMAYFGTVLSKSTFDKYPSVSWSKGVGEFFTTFSDLDIADDPQKAANGIMILAGAYLKLAKSLNILGGSMKGITDLPDMTPLYGGLITLSLVNSDALGSVLDVLDDKQAQFAKVYSVLKANKDISINDSSFAFNKDKKDTTKSSSSSSTTTQSSAPKTQTVKAPTTPSKPTESVSDMLMKKMVDLQNQMLSVMNEIADNTTKSLASDSNMINH